jgi:hypothetical protein
MGSGSDIDLAILIPDDSGIDQAEQALAPVGEALRERFGNRLQLTLGASSVVKSQSRLPGAALWRRILAEGLPLIDRRTTQRKGNPRLAHGQAN